jgi:hypothetical protein
VPTTLKVWGELDFDGVIEEHDTAIVMAQFLLGGQSVPSGAVLVAAEVVGDDLQKLLVDRHCV